MFKRLTTDDLAQINYLNEEIYWVNFLLGQMTSESQALDDLLDRLEQLTNRRDEAVVGDGF